MYPKLKVPKTDRQMVDVFRGYNHNLRIGDGEFFDMENMTSDYYPVLSPRKARGSYHNPEKPNGIIGKDVLCYVDGESFVVGETKVNMGLSDGEKQLISMGAYVIIWPDKKYINTMDLADYGSMEASCETSGSVSFTLCSVTGDPYTDATVSETAPEGPENMDLWIDTSSTPHTLKRYSSTSEMWVSIATTYVKISAEGIGKAFKVYDGVTISGITAEGAESLNGSHALWGCTDDSVIVVGLIDKAITQDDAVMIARELPKMDFITESENRLWGCRYGTAANGQTVNEIYASKLGDFKNWNCFMDLSTDSYTASCGTDGPFTGAITHMGYPLFFKENCVHKVYGNYPANFQIQTTACRGVQKGCEKSLAIVNEILYYKARSGVCAYDGSLPVEMSAALGEKRYGNAVAGAHGNKYYISMQESGVYQLFVYDTAKGMWHREDALKVDGFCSFGAEMYAIIGGKIITMLGSGTKGTEKVAWSAQTGEIGLSTPDMKYISRLTLRMAMDIGSEVRLYAQYDFSDEWELLCSLRSGDLRSFSIPVRPKRCDHMRLKIEGEGPAKIYSITKTIAQGSELS
jgi:hypothetical protein